MPMKSVVRLTDRPDMTLDIYRERKTTIQQQQQQHHFCLYSLGKQNKKIQKLFLFVKMA